MALLGAGCAAAPTSPARVRVSLVDHAGLEAEIARHRGKVVVLDCWSTSCPPCVREFPRLVALQERHGDDVACLSLSFDYEGIGAPEDVRQRVETFLTEVGAGRVVNLLGSEDCEAMYQKLGLFSVPAVYVYRPNGSLLQRFDDDDATKRLGRPFTYDDVEEAVRAALGR